MLVKLAFVMQRLKKISKKIFVMINKDGGTIFGFYGGGHSCYEGGHRAHGEIPPVPPLGENPDIWCLSKGVLLPVVVCSYVFFHI